MRCNSNTAENRGSDHWGCTASIAMLLAQAALAGRSACLHHWKVVPAAGRHPGVL